MSILLLIGCFLMEFCTSTPVFSMGGPATKIGGLGRNIRNLPCVSRRNNEKGICMFAIDCQKANGTHLGTCIDKFYFGSCCKILNTQEIVDNTIDTAIIPSREPPSRISTTSSTTSSVPTISTTTIKTTQIPENVSSTSQTSKIVTFTTAPNIIKIKNITSTIAQSTQIYESKSTTSKITSLLSTISTLPPFFSSLLTNEITEKPIITSTAETSFKLTTFQTVDESTISAEQTTIKTTKPQSITNQSTQTTKVKPTDFNSKLNISFPTSSTEKLITTTIKPLLRPRPSSNTTAKPSKFTRPTLSRYTTKPTFGVPARLTTKKTNPTISTRVTLKRNPSTTISTTTKRYITEKITKPYTTTTGNPISESKSTLIDVTPSITTLGYTFNSPAITSSTTGNITSVTTEHPIETNEIEQAKPLQPPPTTEEPLNNSSLVTWTDVVNEETSIKVEITSPSSGEWSPITVTTDGWVLLPNLSTTQTSASTDLNNTSVNETSTERLPETTSPSVTTAQFNYSTENSTTTNSPTTINVTTSAVYSTVLPNLQESSSAPQSSVNMSDFTDVCGRRLYPEARIVGGERATFGKWPWQISLRQWRTSTYLHKCGAALLNENWAITAAHCVDNVPPSDLLLRLGEHDLSTDNEPYIHQERRVQIVASHPQFDPRTFEYDLALLRFYEPVQFQPNIIPVCVPTTDETFVGRTAHVTGWGRLYEDGPLPSVLQQVSVPVINNSVCESMYRAAGYIEHIPHIFICAGWRRGGFDSCEGDSGGPMVIQRADKRFLLAGVISWGIGCAEPNQPGVYTRISEFKDWINQILQF